MNKVRIVIDVEIDESAAWSELVESPEEWVQECVKLIEANVLDDMNCVRVDFDAWLDNEKVQLTSPKELSPEAKAKVLDVINQAQIAVMTSEEKEELRRKALELLSKIK